MAIDPKQKKRMHLKIFFMPIIMWCLIPEITYAKLPVMVTSILANLDANDAWGPSVFSDAKTVFFNQTANTTSGVDASEITMITLSYFTSSDCSGTTAGSYTTPSSGAPSFPISINQHFGLVQTSTWDVANSLGIPNLTTLNSLAITFYSTDKTIPQSNFSSSSFSCIPLACSAGPNGVCSSTNITQNFTLKTTVELGDPANGGIIACMDPTISPPTYAGYLIAHLNDNGTNVQWGGTSTTTHATSTTNGVTNTSTVVNMLGLGTAYAAGLCNVYAGTGGFTTGWFLPAIDQLNCLYQNRIVINASNANYWSSTEMSVNNALLLGFNGGGENSVTKNLIANVRCVRGFIPS